MIAALGTALCWTVSSLLYKIGTQNASALDANTARALPTIGVLLLLTVLLRGVNFSSDLTPSIVTIALLSGVIGLAVGDTIYIFSIDRAGVARAVPVSAIYSLLTAIIGFAFFQVQFTRYVLLGTTAVVLGLWLLTFQGKNTGGASKQLRIGILAALAAACVWSLSINLMNEALRQGDPVEVNLLRSSALILLFPLQLLPRGQGHGVLRLSRRGWIAMALGGIIALSLGWTLLAYSTALIGVARAVPLSSISPFFSTLAGALILREKVTIRIYAGSLIIVIGAILVSIT